MFACISITDGNKSKKDLENYQFSNNSSINTYTVCNISHVTRLTAMPIYLLNCKLYFLFMEISLNPGKTFMNRIWSHNLCYMEISLNHGKTIMNRICSHDLC